jgi:hypothetical protein
LTATGIVRGKIKNNMWVESQDIFESLPYTKTFHHFGSRIAFDKKGLDDGELLKIAIPNISEMASFSPPGPMGSNQLSKLF